jgi:hypothetical protein
MGAARRSPADQLNPTVDDTARSTDPQEMNHSAPTPQPTPQPNPNSNRSPGPFFRITIMAGALFVVTILAMIASALGAAPSSPARMAFDDNAGWLLAIEVLAILGSAFLAMAGDRPEPHEHEPTDQHESIEEATD